MRTQPILYSLIARMAIALIAIVGVSALTACGNEHARANDATVGQTGHTMSDHAGSGPSIPVRNDTTLPADAEHVVARLNSSPRHGEYVTIALGGKDSLRAWVVYPQKNTRAPVVIVIQEIFGLSPWVRGVADQLAADGFVAIAPDLLSPMPEKPRGWPDSVSRDDGVAATMKLNPDSVQRWIDATAKYGMALSAAMPKYGVVGFCWGGGQAFLHATHAPSLSAAVVYYGTSPDTKLLSKVQAPVLGLYGANDARVTTTVPPADSAMKALKKTFEPHMYEGAGHGFLRMQGGENGANLKAAQLAWPATLAWFRQYLARDATASTHP